MFKSLLVKNFHSHENTLLQFSDGVNAIIGRSNRGKSALLRAFLWLATNRPSGTRFHSHFANESSPTITSANVNDVVVSLTKTPDGKAEYKVGKDSFAGFGKNVPDQVIEALGIIPFLNIQKQVTLPFLITSSPAEIGEAINKVTNLEQPEQWIKKLIRLHTQETNTVANLEKELLDKQEELKAYSEAEKFASLAEDFATLVSQHDRLQEEGLALQRYYKQWCEASRRVVVIEKALENVEQLLKRATTLRDSIEQMEEEEKQINRALVVNEQLIGLEKSKEAKRTKLIDLLAKYKQCPWCQSTITTKQIEQLVGRL